jgi:ElaB/YqjD/DUF883 family membrane-anchored ribosome-binding protein
VVDKAKDMLSAATYQLRDKAQQASELATDYAKEEPLKALLMVAGVGALLMALLSVMARRD